MAHRWKDPDAHPNTAGHPNRQVGRERYGSQTESTESDNTMSDAGWYRQEATRQRLEDEYGSWDH